MTQPGYDDAPAIPMILNQFWLAGWLIVKGFDAAALATCPPDTASAPTPDPARP